MKAYESKMRALLYMDQNPMKQKKEKRKGKEKFSLNTLKKSSSRMIFYRSPQSNLFTIEKKKKKKKKEVIGNLEL